MANLDRPLFTSQVVDSKKPGLVAIDLAEHEVIEKSPQELVKMVGRERFRSSLGSYVAALSTLGGLGAFGWGIFNWVNTGHLEVHSGFGYAPILLTGGRILLERSKRLSQKADAIEQTLNAK